MSLVGKFFLIDDILKDWYCNNIDEENVDVYTDICYEDINPKVTVGDLYLLRDKKEKYRVLINVHGGGWVVGDKYWRRGYCEIFARKGIAVFNINYGLSPEYTYPYCVLNAFASLKWIYENAEKYNFDTENIYMSGDSAGGQIACMVGALQDNIEEREKLGIPYSDARLKGLVLFSGAYEMEKLLSIKVASAIAREVTGLNQKELKNYSHYDYLFPINFIDKNFPKAYIVGAKLDVFCFNQDLALINKLKAMGVPYMHYRSKHLFTSDHCFHLRYKRKDSREALQGAIDFILNDNIINNKTVNS